MSQLFGGATAKALQATLDDITTERTDGDQGCINVSTSWMRHSGYPVFVANSGVCPSIEQHLKQQYAAMLQNAPMATRAAWLNGKWDEAPPVAKKEPVCECGVKFTGGLHSTWCPCHV